MTFADPEPPAHTADSTPQPLPPAFAQRVPFTPSPTVIGTPVRTARNSSGGGVVFAFLVLLALAGAAVWWFVLREQDNSPQTAPVAVSTVVGDDGPASAAVSIGGALPDLTFARPPATTAVFTELATRLGRVAGAATTGDVTMAVTADHARGIARVEGSGTLLVNGAPQTVVVTREHQYRPSDVFGQPWTRTARPADDGAIALDAYEHLLMYQELVTPQVREAARNVTQTTELVGTETMTTYRFDIDTRVLGENTTWSAADAGAFTGSVTVSIDSAGFVRHLRIALEEGLVRPLIVDDSQIVTLVRDLQVTAIGTPVDVELPPNFVDG